jgi:phage baseplate assembly protein W
MAAVIRADRFSPNLKKKILYKDLFSSVMFNRDTSDINTIDNEDAVKQSILNILLTNRGERHFNTSFGSDINSMLFENITPQTSTSIVKIIETAIENFEPRAILLDVTASPLEEQNAYSVSVVFKVINKTEPITVDFILNRVR